MSKKTCHECENSMHQLMCSNTLCPIDDESFAEQCGGFTQIQKCPKTVFDTITSSLEPLAEKLVYDWGHLCHNGDIKIYWKSTILPDSVFYSKAEAIAATVEKLNKEVKDVE